MLYNSLYAKNRYADSPVGLGIRSLVFWAKSSFFAKKWANEQFAQKTSDSLIHSFFMSDLSDLLTSLIKKEGMSESLIFKNKNLYKTY